MSTFVDFQPSTQTAFSFQATMAGQQYTIVITWSLSGQRYYLNVYDLSQNLIVCRSLVSSGPVITGQFTWSLGIASITTITPHNVPLGQVAAVWISQTDTVFDGAVQVLATGPSTLTYQLATNPNESNPVTGAVNFSLNLVDGYDIGYFLYHYSTQQFEFG